MSVKKFTALLLLLFGTVFSYARQTFILATTTSVDDSGLLDILLPVFEEKYNCSVKVIAVGSGQAIRLGRDGNADVLLVHDPESEEKFVQDGFGTKKYPVATNDFVIVGPIDDPAGIKKSTSASTAFQLIASSAVFFVSRGDNSGTHKKELAIWKTINKPIADIRNSSSYIESGAGMEQTLSIADEKNAYCLTDRATWLAHQSKLIHLKICFQNDPMLINYYSVIPVSPKKFPRTNYQLTKKFGEFITGVEGQKIIGEFGQDQFGQSLFHPVKNLKK